MINSYQNHPQKNSIFGLLALSLPFEDVEPIVVNAGGSAEELNPVNSSWTLSFLLILVNDLDISEDQIHAYLPIIVSSIDSPAQRIPFELRKDFAQPFLQKLSLSYSDKILLLLRVLFRIAMIRMYDGRGRSFFRNLSALLEVLKDDAVHIEERVSTFFYTHVDTIETMIKAEASEDETNSKRNAKLLRYAKIGAVSIGAGALLAFTGGLAAPALAAAFLTMGSASAAAAVSVTTMATVFGSAGAGLAGYKMLRRTRGLQEFEFESYGDKNKFAMMIVVSGWIEQDEDEKRAFGIVPAVMSDEERLTRFYEVNCPERLTKVDKELDNFFYHMDDLYNQITQLFGKDPRDNRQLAPLHPLDTSEEALKVINTFLTEIEQSTTGGASEGKKSMSSTASKFLQSTSTSIFGKKNKKTKDNNNSSNPLPPSSHQSRESNGSDEEGLETISLKEVSEKSERRSLGDYWNWGELEESKVYELCLLRWETRLQKEMGNSIHELVKSLGSSAVENILAATVLTAVASAVLFPVLLIQLTSVIDNSWAMAVETADAAGKELAQAILNRSTGTRPITLVGFSFGARVIYSCLRELALLCGDLSDFDFSEDQFTTEDGRRKSSAAVEESEASGRAESTDDKSVKLTKLEIRSIIQDVVLLGAPVSSKSRAWSAIRSMVSGRVINGYSQKDLVLGLIYRYQRFHYSVSGVCEIENVPGVENVDLSGIIESHTDYGKKMKQILQFIDLTKSV